MDLTWIAMAFAFGLAVKKLGQAPLLGFLVAGFVLKLLGIRPDASLDMLANTGVFLLLFAIGLKLDLPSLMRPHVFGSSLIHAGLVTALGAGLAAALKSLGWGPFAELPWPGVVAVGFVGCFSSTLFSVKIIEERDNMNALYGRLIIGVLVVQDLVAVAFLAATKGTLPSPWAVGLVLLLPLRPVLGRLLTWAGHRELLVLAGIALTLGGAKLFDVVGLKADLGPLVLGALVGGLPKSKELSQALLSIKDLLLVGFFVTIGLTGLPTLDNVLAGLALGLVLPLKGLLFLWLFTRFGLRARTAWLASLGLTPYSEFGLVVGAVAVAKGWLPAPWMVTLALAMGFSFIPLSLLNSRAFALYRRHRERLAGLEGSYRIPEEEPVEVRAELGDEDVVAFDVDERVVAELARDGRRVFEASATDADFWERLEIDREGVELVLLAIGSHEENRAAVEQLRKEGFEGTIAVTARYDDEVLELTEDGADMVFHKLADAGSAFATAALAQRAQA